MSKRLLSLFLVLCLTIGLFPVSVFADVDNVPAYTGIESDIAEGDNSSAVTVTEESMAFYAAAASACTHPNWVGPYESDIGNCHRGHGRITHAVIAVLPLDGKETMYTATRLHTAITPARSIA